MKHTILLLLSIASANLAAQVDLTQPLEFVTSPLTINFDNLDVEAAIPLNPTSWVFTGSPPDYEANINDPALSTSDIGIYSLEYGLVPGNRSLYIQGEDSDFSPGCITLKIKNNSLEEMTNIKVSFDVLFYNFSTREFTVSFGTPTVPDLYKKLLGESSKSGTALVLEFDKPGFINIPMNVLVGETLILKWTVENTGSGFSDGFGLDNIVVTASPPLPPAPLVPTMSQWSLLIMGLIMSCLGLVVLGQKEGSTFSRTAE